eukprot:tig00020509_g9746.t1
MSPRTPSSTAIMTSGSVTSQLESWMRVRACSSFSFRNASRRDLTAFRACRSIRSAASATLAAGSMSIAKNADQVGAFEPDESWRRVRADDVASAGRAAVSDARGVTAVDVNGRGGWRGRDEVLDGHSIWKPEGAQRHL